MIALFQQKIHNFISDKKFSEILTGSVWALGARIISTLLAMITSIIVARVYGAEVMGIVAMVNSFLTLATIFTVLGTNSSILRLIPEHIAKYSVTSAYRVYRKVQFLVATLSIVTGVLLFLNSSLIASKIFSKPHLAFFFSLAAIFVCCKSIATLNTQAVRGLRLIRTFAFMQLLPATANLIALIMLSLCFVNQNIPIYAFFTSLGITSFAGMWIMDVKFKMRLDNADVVKDTRLLDIIAISWPMLMTTTLYFVISQIGIIILSIYRPDADVGYYSAAVKLSTLTTFVLQAINSMAAPKFSELFHTGKIDELLHIARQSSKLIFLTTTPILICLLVFGKIVLRAIFGQDFAVTYTALIFLVLGQFINAISGSTGIFMNMTGHEKKLKNIISIAALINIAFSFLLTPRYGMNGTAFSVMVSTSFWNIYTLLYIKSKFGISIGYLPMFKSR